MKETEVPNPGTLVLVAVSLGTELLLALCSSPNPPQRRGLSAHSQSESVLGIRRHETDPVPGSRTTGVILGIIDEDVQRTIPARGPSNA